MQCECCPEYAWSTVGWVHSQNSPISKAGSVCSGGNPLVVFQSPDGILSRERERAYRILSLVRASQRCSFILTVSQQPVVAVPLVPAVSRRKEEELSAGSAPLAKQQSYQASEYASSPIKTKTVTGMCQQIYQFFED